MMKIAKNSLKWILTPLIFTIIFIFFSLVINNFVFHSIFVFIAFIFLLISIFLFVFFRDPDRKTGIGIVSPADGKIREIAKINDRDLGDIVKISIFMNIYNVHVNRMPIDGKITDIVHKPGGYIPAFKKESERNERMIMNIKSDIGIIKMVLIAGSIARRIFLYVKKADFVKKGKRTGIIRLGSRVDMYIPNDKISKIKVKIGDIVKAGESTIAEINS